MKTSRLRSALFATVLLGGCTTFPSGPSVMSLPGTGANFDQFRNDDLNCQVYARNSSGQPTSQQAAANSGANSAAVGTLIGAAAGGLLGAASGEAAAGAAIGAGSGLIIGSAAGTDSYGMSGMAVQERYDNAYVQCMYANGHQVPVSPSVAANMQASPSPNYTGAPPLPSRPPVGNIPPPNTPPPPGY